MAKSTPTLLSQALTEGKTCFLPVVNQRDEQLLSFAPYDSATELVENQWGIAEPPAPATEISPTGFDLVLCHWWHLIGSAIASVWARGFMTERSVLRFSIAAVSLC